MDINFGVTPCLRTRSYKTKRSVQRPLNINPLSYLLSLLRQNGLQRADNLSSHAFTSTIGPRGVSHSKTMVCFERVAQLCYHAILEVRGGITHPHTRHPHSLAPIEQVFSRNLGCASLGWLQGTKFDKSSMITNQDVAKSILLRQTLTTFRSCLLYTSPSPRDGLLSRMPSSA